jgi:hypothetical protein
MKITKHRKTWPTVARPKSKILYACDLVDRACLVWFAGIGLASLVLSLIWH